MHQSVIILAIITLFCTGTYAQISKKTKECIQAGESAKKDMYNKEMKYYTFGLLPPDSLRYFKALILKEFYNVEIKHIGCVMHQEFICYNKMADRVLKLRYGSDIWEMVTQKADSIMKAYKK